MISPFRDVAFRLSDICRSWGCKTFGTVHTAQGKEADVVILVLGGDPSKKGAKRFAYEKPNLVNVAVSRAKRRLYVVGNRQDWGSLPNFAVLSSALPTSK